MSLVVSTKVVTAEDAIAGFQVSSMVLQEHCRAPQKKAVLGENKTEACTGVHITKRKSAQDPDDGE